MEHHAIPRLDDPLEHILFHSFRGLFGLGLRFFPCAWTIIGHGSA